jgi:hypothetical protein
MRIDLGDKTTWPEFCVDVLVWQPHHDDMTIVPPGYWKICTLELDTQDDTTILVWHDYDALPAPVASGDWWQPLPQPPEPAI